MHTAHSTPIKKAFFTEDLVQNPYSTYQRFLEQGPVHYLDRGPGPGLWGVFTYTDCASLLKDHRLTAKRSGSLLLAFPLEQQANFGPLARMLGQWMLFLDAPEHSRLRKLMNKGFSPAVTEALRAPIATIVNEMVDSFKSASQAELMQEIAHPLPVRVITEMLGVPHSMHPQFTAWSDAIAKFIGNPKRTLEQTTSAQEAILELTAFFWDTVSQRRRNKRDDLISLLLDIEADGEVLTEEELYAQCVMLLFAGHETTRNLIGNGMLTLLQNAGEASRLREEPSLIRSAVEELLRYESPVQSTGRLVKEEMELHGEPLVPGTIVYLMLGSANRDPQQFKDPDSLNLARLNNSHLAFGAGAHFCIGNQIARLEAQCAILALIDRFPRMQLTEQRPQWLPNFALRGLTSLPVSLV